MFHKCLGLSSVYFRLCSEAVLAKHYPGLGALGFEQCVLKMPFYISQSIWYYLTDSW